MLTAVVAANEHELITSNILHALLFIYKPFFAEANSS